MPVLADPVHLIDWFDEFLGSNPYCALSNYYRKSFKLDGITYACAEQAYQAWKAATDSGFKRLLKIQDADQAKTAGR
jgi:predicted NAD-dependent protein-ADP-ribosyltransferase YbiA (DUF1768 family)